MNTWHGAASSEPRATNELSCYHRHHHYHHLHLANYCICWVSFHFYFDILLYKYPGIFPFFFFSSFFLRAVVWWTHFHFQNYFPFPLSGVTLSSNKSSLSHSCSLCMVLVRAWRFGERGVWYDLYLIFSFFVTVVRGELWSAIWHKLGVWNGVAEDWLIDWSVKVDLVMGLLCYPGIFFLSSLSFIHSILVSLAQSLLLHA